MSISIWNPNRVFLKVAFFIWVSNLSIHFLWVSLVFCLKFAIVAVSYRAIVVCISNVCSVYISQFEFTKFCSFAYMQSCVLQVSFSCSFYIYLFLFVFRKEKCKLQTVFFGCFQFMYHEVNEIRFKLPSLQSALSAARYA